MVAMLGVASGRVVRSFQIQVAKATNGQKNGYVEESMKGSLSYTGADDHRVKSFIMQHTGSRFYLFWRNDILAILGLIVA